jgi:hypothetical protein
MRFSAHSRRLRPLLVAGAAATALGLAPGAAGAATVNVTGGELTYTAAPGESNNVVVAPWGLSLRVTDTGTKAGVALPLTSGPGCWKLSTIAATCSLSVTGLTVSLGDGNDSFDGTLIAIPTTVFGGTGSDRIATGSGADTIDVRDGEVDSVTCGAGQDTVSADRTDSVAGDCETVTVPALVGGAPVDPGVDPAAGVPDPGAGTGTGAPTGANPGATPAAAGKPNSVPPTIPPQTVAVSPSGVAAVQVACPADSGGCRGTVTLELPLGSATGRGRVAVAAGRATSVQLGQAHFSAKAGTKTTVRVRLSKRGRQRILRNVHSHCRIVVRTVAADGTAVVSTQDVTLARRQPPRPSRPTRGTSRR